MAGRTMKLTMLVLAILFAREQLEAPAPPPPPSGCVVVISTAGPVVICR